MMKHETYREWLVLEMVGELPNDQRKLLDEHIRSCPDCRNEQAVLRKLGSLTASQETVPVSEDFLVEARGTMRDVLRHERLTRPGGSRKGFRDRLSAILDQMIPIVLKPAIVSVSMFVVGLGFGHMLFAPGSSSTMGASGNEWLEAAERGDAFITSVRFVDPDPLDGEVEFTFDALTPVRVRGSVNDQNIQRVLAQALLHEHNPGVRIRAVSAFAQAPPREADPIIKRALFDVLLSDENAGVRKAALMVLRSLPFDREIRDALISVLLRDNNDGIRIDAISYLGEAENRQMGLSPEFRQALERKMSEEKNDYIKNRTLTLIREVREQ